MSLVRKILEATIPSGGSSATFTDSDIPNSLIRVYSTNSNIYPQNISLTGNTLTVTYEPVTSNMGVAVELVKQGLEIDDNLTSDNTDHALSAKQGKVLKGLIDNMPDKLSSLSDVDIADIEDGQVIAWDAEAEKFVNVDQSGSSITLTTKAWTASVSSSANTILTETATLTSGLYMIHVHMPYSTDTSLFPFGLYINNSLDVNCNCHTCVSYGNFTQFLQVSETSTVAVCTVSSTTVSWDSDYLTRGGMNIIKLS